MGNALRHKLHALRAGGIETRVFAHVCDDPEASDVRVVSSLDEARRDPFYQRARLHIFEFGWEYLLFDLLAELPRTARSMVFFHGVTPRHFLPDRDREGHDRSLLQFEHAKRADLVLAASRYSSGLLAGRGIDPSRIRMARLPVMLPRVPPTRAPRATIKLLFVGRIVPSKGLLDLLQALARLRDTGRTNWELAIASNPITTNDTYLKEVSEFADSAGLAPHLRFLGKVESRLDIAKLYAETAAIIIPTSHETYCLPALEGLASGCAVVAYDVAALPEITCGLAQLVEPGRVEALARAIALVCAAADRGEVPIARGEPIPRGEFERRARAATKHLSIGTCADEFMTSVRELAGAGPGWAARLRALLRGRAAGR